MDTATVNVRAPELHGEKWINSGVLKLSKHRGKVVLIDFWDYTCVNCLRTMPYLKEWYRRYKDKGLVIIGIHTPEFEFAKEKSNVEEAVKRLGIEWPVLLDNEYKNWDAFANHYWPHKYLIDSKGIIRYEHIGEGAYGDMEEQIQRLLIAANPELVLPPILEPLTKSEMPGAVCYRMTPELYAGYNHGRPGNPEGYQPDQVAAYKDPGKHVEEAIFLQGVWESRPESIRHARSTSSLEDYILLHYRGIEVNAVIRPETQEAFRVYVYQNGLPLNPEDKGEDIFYDDGHNAYLLIDRPRMYKIVNNKHYGIYNLKLASDSDSFALYAFTFGACEIPEKTN